MRTLLGAVAVLLLVGAAAGAGSGALSVAHEPVRCVLAERYPLLDACVEPADRVARVRAFFRADAAPEWHFVDLSPVGKCYRGALPQPRPSTRRVSYYLVATDVFSRETRTPDTEAEVVADEKSCRSEPLGPFLSSASVVVGGRGLPAGFVGGPGGGAGGVKVAAAVLGGGAVAGGALLVSRNGGSSASTAATGAGQPPVEGSTTTTTAAPAPRSPANATTTTTTTTTATTRPASTTTTTTRPGGCTADSGPPTVAIQSPKANDQVGASVVVSVDARDKGPASNGVRQVRLYAQLVGGVRLVAIATLTGAGPSYSTTWVGPPCGGPQDRWDISAEATDGCGRTGVDTVRVRRKPSSCGVAGVPSQDEPSQASWTSELSIAGAQGQLIANGSDAAFTRDRRSQLTLSARRGANRVEAVLVEASGAPGLWRLSLAAGALKPGSLRALAGEVAAIEADAIVFRLRGRPGERVVFGYELE